MKTLLRLFAMMLCLGMLGAAACSSCSQTTDTSGSALDKPSMTCGAGTHLVGTVCVNGSK